MPSLMTTTGEGRAIVQVDYDIDDDGDVTNMDVTYQGVTVNGVMSSDQIEDMEQECWAHYIKWAKEENDEAAIERYLSSMECEA